MRYCRLDAPTLRPDQIDLLEIGEDNWRAREVTLDRRGSVVHRCPDLRFPDGEYGFYDSYPLDPDLGVPIPRHEFEQAWELGRSFPGRDPQSDSPYLILVDENVFVAETRPEVLERVASPDAEGRRVAVVTSRGEQLPLRHGSDGSLELGASPIPGQEEAVEERLRRWVRRQPDRPWRRYIDLLTLEELVYACVTMQTRPSVLRRLKRFFSPR
jgi:hypothetical protein